MNGHRFEVPTWVRLALFAGLLLAVVAPAASARDAGERAWTGDRSGLLTIDKLDGWRSPAIDVAALLLEDEANLGRDDIPDRVGFPMKVDLSPANAGTWEDLPDGDRLWRLRITTDGAIWTVLGFDRFALQPGAAMSVADPDGTTIMGPYTSADIRSHGQLWFPPIAGDTLVVEVYWPKSLGQPAPDLHLGTVSHGYEPWGVIGRDQATDGLGDSGSCNIDTACPEGIGWEDQTRSVVMVLVGGSGNCSGSMLNTTAGDCRTMMLTAAHCGEDGPSTTLGFNFVRPGCNTGTPPPETNQTLTGGVLRGNSSASDFTLIEMDEAPPEEYGVYFSGWSRDPNPPAATWVISHPRGDVKKIAHDADPPVDGTNWGPNHWRIDDSNPDPAHVGYEWGTTEPASSGSPLFDDDQRVIGQLHGGTASCTSDTYDEYGKVDVSWDGGGTPATRMSDWLDPLGTGAIAIDGIDHSICLYQPAGEVLFDRALYGCSDPLTIHLRDDNIPGDPTTVDVTVSSATEVTAETLTLTQIEPGVGRYNGTLPTTTAPPVNGDGQLSVADGDILTVNYVDADDGAGGFDVTVKDNADVDCGPPVIVNVQSSEVTGNSARITWDTDEPSDSAVTHGLTPPGDSTATDPGLVTAHGVRLTGLQECSVHYYSVASADVVGNAAADDNGGALYTFETSRNVEPEFPSTDTPIAIADNATHLSTIGVVDDKTVLDVRVRIDITHTYTGDLDITLIAPDGTRVLLVADTGGGGDNFTDTVFDDAAATPIGSGTPPFTGPFQPASPLAAATGIRSQGDWTLEVVDDAGGDTGTLNDWSLTLTFADQQCGPSATYGRHDLEADTCAGGPGDDNAVWESGEQVRFSVTVDNNGTEPLTGVTAIVTPVTAGVVMLDGEASYADIAVGGSSVSAPPHYDALLPTGLTCGGTIEFSVAISSDQGNWNSSFTQVVGEVIPGGGVALFEDFDAAGIPVDWTVVDGLSDGFTWYADDATDPAGCANTDPAPPLAGTWAAVDSDCAGSGVTMDEELISPAIDVSVGQTVALEFDHYFNWLGPEFADVDVRSSLTAGAWVNVARWTADTNNPDHALIDITAQAAGASDLQIRWHYYNAEYEWFWYVDNVTVTYTSAGDCVMNECLSGSAAPPPIPDGSLATQPLTAARLDAAGAQIRLDWDTQCSPAFTNLLYGPLDQVSSLTLGGSECSLDPPYDWNSVPAGDLWFLLVTDDGAGVESSWGLGTAGERNGLTPSGACLTTSKDATGVCP